MTQPPPLTSPSSCAFPGTWAVDVSPGGTRAGSLNHFLLPQASVWWNIEVNDVPWGTVQVNGSWYSTWKNGYLAQLWFVFVPRFPHPRTEQSVHSRGTRKDTADEGSVDMPAMCLSPDCFL